MIPPPDPFLLVSPCRPSEISKWTNAATEFLNRFLAVLALPAAPTRQEIIDDQDADAISVRLVHPLFEVALRAGEPGTAVSLEYAAGRPERRERTGGLYAAVLADAMANGVSPHLLMRCRSLAGVEFPRIIERDRAKARQRVAWAPDPLNNLGAVMAPPGPLSMRAHLDLLADRVQEMVDALDDPRAELRQVERELLEYGMQPDLRRPEAAGWEIVQALEATLSAIGALSCGSIVPVRSGRAARDAIEDKTLMDWVSQVLSS
jgi:hypothetical protein